MRLTADIPRFAHVEGTGPPVLRDVRLVVTPGESVALLGPSGSGKTTLLALLGGLLRTDLGIVGVQVEDGSQEAVDGHVAWVLQTTNALGQRTCTENVALGCLAEGLTWRAAQERAASALRPVGLAHRASSPARTLSGGELQRMVIARALVSSRAFVLADEPTGQLDGSTSRLVADALFTALEPGRAIIVATHDPELAERCDRVLRIVDGRIVDGRTDQPADRS